ncbi:hypothetical protein SH412_005318 [Planctellipticum variicoloris]|nr:hypothetical protein SH412_005318 [Planctomycetaceae bacterium SH412]
MLRAYLRQRSMLTEHACQHILHMLKALTQMNLKLDKVLSDITGVTGLLIIDARWDGLAGESRGCLPLGKCSGGKGSSGWYSNCSPDGRITCVWRRRSAGSSKPPGRDVLVIAVEYLRGGGGGLKCFTRPT